MVSIKYPVPRVSLPCAQDALNDNPIFTPGSLVAGELSFRP